MKDPVHKKNAGRRGRLNIATRLARRLRNVAQTA